MSEREERVARNEATVREMNEKIEQAQAGSPDSLFRSSVSAVSAIARG